MNIAFYGKGGIGKSTIAANVSAECGAAGKKVLHIGCDPKADSTRLLVNKKIPTVLQMLESKGNALSRNDIIYQGKNGVYCVEAGGPHAGVGCAGLGITAAMKELERLQVFQEEWDLVVYDVLGDVVCGGFSVPMRKHYADKVFIVSSTDYMSLYAANNILQGCLRYSDNQKNLVGGLILNHVKNEQEEKIGALFTKYTGISIEACLEESTQMRLADYQNHLFTEKELNGNNTCEIKNLVRKITANDWNVRQMKTVHAMEQEEMEQFRAEIFESGWLV